MFIPRGQIGSAKARYRSVDLSSRIESASPHQLVVLMYEEALRALEAMSLAIHRGDFARRGQSQARALAIVNSLETSLDFDKGGEVAIGLSRVYREAKKLISAGGRDGDAKPVEAATLMLRQIAEAWSQIGQPAN